MSKRASRQKSYLAPSDVAQILMVSPATIRHWASKGDLAAVATPGGHRRFLLHDIEQFARDKELSMQIPNDNTLRILIVDDDTHVAEYLSRLLDRVNAKTEKRVAHDGFNAGKLVHTFQPHIVLLDLMMPELNGFDVCRQIKQDTSTRATRVIAMTGFYNEENVTRALDAGAECCIEKPFDYDKLLRLLGLSGTDLFEQAID